MFPRPVQQVGVVEFGDGDRMLLILMVNQIRNSGTGIFDQELFVTPRCLRSGAECRQIASACCHMAPVTVANSAEKKERKKREVRFPEDDLSGVDIEKIPLLKAFCMHCSYLKDKDGKKIFKELSKKRNKKGEFIKIYESENRLHKVTYLDLKSGTPGSFHYEGICTSCGKNVSSFVSKKIIFPEKAIEQEEQNNVVAPAIIEEKKDEPNEIIVDVQKENEIEKQKE